MLLTELHVRQFWSELLYTPDLEYIAGALLSGPLYILAMRTFKGLCCSFGVSWFSLNVRARLPCCLLPARFGGGIFASTTPLSKLAGG